MPDVQHPALCVVTGLLGTAATAAPVPAAETAQLQLRALNHRFIDGRSADGAALLEALVHDDFLFTRADGAWLARVDFIGQQRRHSAPPEATLHDEPVRLFGPVALLHGAYVQGATRLRYTDVYLWRGSGWQLVGAQDTALRDGVALGQVDGTAPLTGKCRGQEPTGTETEVLTTLNEHYVRAFREADIDWYDAHLAPDFGVISGDGSHKTRAAALAAFALPTFSTSMRSFPVAQVRVRLFGDLALIHASNDYLLKDGRSGESRYTDIWHRQGGRWRCVAAHITVHRAPSIG